MHHKYLIEMKIKFTHGITNYVLNTNLTYYKLILALFGGFGDE